MIGIGVNIIPFISKAARAVGDYIIRVTSNGGVSESTQCVNTTLSQLDSQDLLDSASLVMIPSGYKEDVVYSQIPTSGAGDLSFTRASNGTRVNSAGLVEVCPWNLVQYSEDLTNAYWFKNNVTISSNTTVAPNGTTTADTFTNSSTGYGIFAILDVIPSQQYTFSFYIKKGTNTSYKLSVIDAVSFTSIASLDYSAEVSATDWVRITSTFTIPSGTTSIRVYQMRDGSTTGTAFLWGAQLNIGATAKPYFPTTDRLNVPRLTYQNGGGGCPSLLLEKQSTNFTLYSEDFTNAIWVLDGDGAGQSVTANYSISPDGTQNADRLQLNKTGGSFSRIRQNTVQIGVYTFSVYLKSNTSSTQNVGIRLEGAGINCAVTPTWQRFSVTTTTLVNAQSQILLFDSISGNDETADISIWGAQLEASSYPTSYIPTTTASATRVADDFTKTGISSLIGQTEGTLFLDFEGGANDGVDYVFGLNDGTADNRIIIYRSSGARVVTEVRTSGTPQATIQTSPVSANSRNKCAIAYKANDIAFYVNGVQVGVDTSATIPTCSGIYSNGGGGSSPFFRPINEIIVFKTRLTNAELAQLTA